MKKTVILIVAAVIVVVVAVLIFRIAAGKQAADPRRGNTPLVKVQKPVRKTMLYKLDFRGDVLPIQQADIYSKVGGNLDKIWADMGMTVRQNQLLALIDTTELSQQYQQASATYENARLNFERTKELAGQNLVAKQDLDNADAAYKVAEAGYRTAGTKLGYARITAPFAGIVTKRYLDQGALVNSNNSILFTLMELNQMKIIVNILEKDIPIVTAGTAARITVEAFPDKVFSGSVARLSEAIDLSTRTMAVEIDIPNREHLLRPGMFAAVSLVIKEHPNAIAVPSAAVLRDDRGAYVFTLVDNTARRIAVTVGVEQDGAAEIVSGLTGGETIITTGQQFVKDGGQVNVQS